MRVGSRYAWVVHPDFAAVAGLPDHLVRDLLGRGDPIEKVWAAWTLALRADGAAAVRAAATTAPEPGVRRHMIVVLVGLGEIDAAVALSRSDPEPAVRATACRYLVRLAPARPELREPGLAGLSDPSPHVREAVVEELGPYAPTPAISTALALAEDPSTDVRRAVVDLVARLVAAGHRFPEAARVRAAREPDPDLRERWQHLWLSTQGPAGFMDLLVAEGSEEAVEKALHRIRSWRIPVAWSDVAAASRLGGTVGPALMAVFTDRLDVVPWSFLLAYLRGRPRAACVWLYLSELCGRLERVRPGDLTAADRAVLAGLAAHARGLARSYEAKMAAAELDPSTAEELDDWDAFNLEWLQALRTFADLADRAQE